MGVQICRYAFRKENVFVMFCNGVCLCITSASQRCIKNPFHCICMYVHRVYVCIFACMWCVYVCVFICASMYVHGYLCMCIYVYESMYVCVYSRVDGFMV